jgi:hypothetical protein
MVNLGIQYGYFGVFAISLVGALSILLPIPDSFAVFSARVFVLLVHVALLLRD